MHALNHHLWRNRRTWWVAFTVLHDGPRKERIRRSLHTHDVELARLRRDAMMQEFAALPDAQLSIRVASSAHCES